MNSREFPIGIRNFEKIRKGDFLYVDKTELIYQLVNSGSYYFLGHPRRFGKSLLVSMLEAYFQGKRGLSVRLALERPEQGWVKHPMFHLDLNIEKYDVPDSLDKILNGAVSKWELIYGAGVGGVTLALHFTDILGRTYERTGERVAILIDEYDKPLLQAIGDYELQSAYHSTLKPFYGVLKTMDGCIKFALLTGATKFGKVNVFSGLNNLNSISMDRRSLNLCGITEKEIHDDFEEDLQALAGMQGMTYEGICNELRTCYDGYHFTYNCEGLYNPPSLFNTFEKKRLGNYQFEVGTPTYLAELFKHNCYNLERTTQVGTDSDVLGSIYGNEDPMPVVFRSGYLAIRSCDKEFRLYRLSFPSREVEEDFAKFLVPFYTHFSKIEAPFGIQRFIQGIRRGQSEAFLKRLQGFFANTPCELVGDLELHYQNVLFIIFELVGFYTQAEYHISKGRIDLMVKTPDYVYVMEFELQGAMEEAIEQTEKEHYACPFETDSRRPFKAGINFNNKTRSIERWVIR